jgi:xylose isomerase
MKLALADNDVKCASIIPDLFADKIYWKGSYTSNDSAVRRRAIEYTFEMCDIALELDCKLINIWPGQDGYDYLFTADYMTQRQWLCDAVAEIALKYPMLTFALEYKPKEPRTHSYIARMADSLLLVQEAGCENVGVTIDTGHAFNAGEVVAESIVLAKRAGDRLYHMHFNDNYTSWDDDMIVGSVHSICFIEMLYWLDKCGYNGWISMDQYPYREDAVGAISESIMWLCQFDEILGANRSKFDELISVGDAVETSRALRKMFLQP